MATAAAVSTMDLGEKVEAGTFILNLTKGSIRTSARVKRERVEKMAGALRESEPETVADMASEAADEIRVSKELLKVEEIRELIAELGSIGTLIRSKSLPGARSILKGGLYVYPYARIAWAERTIKAAQERIDTLLAALEPRYEAIVAEDEKRLAPLGLFDREDYPTLATIRERTRLRYSWLRFSVPGELRTLNPEAFAAEREKARAMWAQTAELVRLAQAERLEQFLAKLNDALSPGEDGRRKVLRQPTIDALSDWLREFDLDDVTNYDELRASVDKVKAALRGVDAEVLRTEERARERVAVTMQQIGQNLSGLVVEQQRRVRLKD